MRIQIGRDACVLRPKNARVSCGFALGWLRRRRFFGVAHAQRFQAVRVKKPALGGLVVGWCGAYAATNRGLRAPVFGGGG
jgi:hypothetical protein